MTKEEEEEKTDLKESKVESSNTSIELRSEEVQEVLGQIPPWILQWGITLLFIVVVGLLIGSYLFKYPDTITAEMTLTSHHPVTQIVSRSSGKLSKLLVKNGDKVNSGMRLAVIENTASLEDVQYVRIALLQAEYNPDKLVSFFLHAKKMTLGDMQASYTAMLTALSNWHDYRNLNYYSQKISSIKNQIARYRSYYKSEERQQQVVFAQYRIAGQQYARDSLLYLSHVIASSEHETSKSTFLQSRYSLEGSKATLENLKIQTGQLEGSLLDLQLEQMEKESTLRQNIQTTAEQLMNAEKSWELAYCLVTPIQGIVTFTTFWNENQYITIGENVFTVVPSEVEQLIGKAHLPVARSGKVRIGQRAIIRFTNYPDQEFGIVEGHVSSISLVPVEGNYIVEINFPGELITNYGIHLPMQQEMKATVEIVTSDLRLIERFFQPIKKILKERL